MEHIILNITLLAAIFFIEGFAPHFRHRSWLDRLRHGIPNLLVAVIGTLTVGFLLLSETNEIMTWASNRGFGLANILPAPWYIRGAVAFVLFDLWMYLWHFAMHMVKPFWRLHSAHHTDTAMDVTTAVRFHPVELLIASVFKIAVLLFIGMQLRFLMFYQSVFMVVVYLQHSNIDLPDQLERRLSTLILTPNLHRVHHSRIKRETNSNYGSVFSFWDRLFGTHRTLNNTRGITLGLETMRESRWQDLRGILITPFVRRL